MENSLPVSQKVKYRVTIWSNSTQKLITKKNENICSFKHYCKHMLIAALLLTTKRCYQSKCQSVVDYQPKCLSIVEWINKMWLSPYDGTLFTHTKE